MRRRYSLSTTRALFAASRIRLTYRPGVIARYDGRAVTMARPRLPYAIATDGRSGGVLHEVRAVFLAWHAGRPAGMLVAVWCGGRLLTAELTGDAERGRRPCVFCPARRAHYGQVWGTA